MEEGPEPHELIEQTVEHQHHEEHARHEAEKRQLRLPAITAALLAVCAAIGSLLSGHAANQAILTQTKASDEWAYYQSKSTKGHLYEVGGKIVDALARDQSPRTGHADQVLTDFRAQIGKYEKEKETSQDKAKDLEAESQHEFHKHHQFALGVASFQVGIVLSSISILVRYRWLYMASLVAGAAGFFFVLAGLLV
jgi:hypothetical protein